MTTTAAKNGSAVDQAERIVDNAELRRIREALQKPNATGVVRTFKLSELIVDPGYQRAVSQRRVAEMARAFDPRLLGTITVGMRNGKLHVIDGQHRVEMAKMIGLKELHGVGLETSSLREEAFLFVALNHERRRLLQQQLFAAMLVSGDRMAREINEMVVRHKFKFHDPGHFVNSREDNTIAAIGSLYQIYKMQGAEVLDDVLRVLRRAWGGTSESLSSRMIRGIARFFHNHPDVSAVELASAIKAAAEAGDPYEILDRAQRVHRRKTMPLLECISLELEKFLG